MNALKLISAVLDYPQPELLAAREELLAVVEQDTLLDGNHKEKLYAWVQQLCAEPIVDLQEQYIDLFDRGRAHSLLLFEHVHGESRDRGQAMVNLMALYQRNGFDIGVRELPDFLPLFLEYLSLRPRDEVQDALDNVAHILAVLAERLTQRQRRYGVLFELLLSLTSEAVDREAIKQQVSSEQPDDTPEALDKVWEEEAVTFGGNAVSGGCPSGLKTSGVKPAGRTVGNINVEAVYHQLNESTELPAAANDVRR